MLIEEHYQRAHFCHVWPDNRMNHLAEKPKELFIGAAEDVESIVVKYPVVGPVAIHDLVLPDSSAAVV